MVIFFFLSLYDSGELGANDITDSDAAGGRKAVIPGPAAVGIHLSREEIADKGSETEAFAAAQGQIFRQNRVTPPAAAVDALLIIRALVDVDGGIRPAGGVFNAVEGLGHIGPGGPVPAVVQLVFFDDAIEIFGCKNALKTCVLKIKGGESGGNTKKDRGKQQTEPLIFLHAPDPFFTNIRKPLYARGRTSDKGAKT